MSSFELLNIKPAVERIRVGFSKMLHEKEREGKKAHRSIRTKCVISVASCVTVPIFSADRAAMFVNVRNSIAEFEESFGQILGIWPLGRL